jgi:hypothetical protein
MSERNHSNIRTLNNFSTAILRGGGPSENLEPTTIRISYYTFPVTIGKLYPGQPGLVRRSVNLCSSTPGQVMDISNEYRCIPECKEPNCIRKIIQEILAYVVNDYPSVELEGQATI